MFINLVLLLFHLFVHLVLSTSDGGSCSIDDAADATPSCSENYQESTNKYLNDYEYAQSNYHSCTQKNDELNCHYAKVIQDDLDQFDKIT